MASVPPSPVPAPAVIHLTDAERKSLKTPTVYAWLKHEIVYKGRSMAEVIAEHIMAARSRGQDIEAYCRQERKVVWKRKRDRSVDAIFVEDHVVKHLKACIKLVEGPNNGQDAAAVRETVHDAVTMTLHMIEDWFDIDAK